MAVPQPYRGLGGLNTKISDPESWENFPFIGNSFLLQLLSCQGNGEIQPFS
jgi:hypothetical protein